MLLNHHHIQGTPVIPKCRGATTTTTPILSIHQLNQKSLDFLVASWKQINATDPEGLVASYLKKNLLKDVNEIK